MSVLSLYQKPYKAKFTDAELDLTFSGHVFPVDN